MLVDTHAHLDMLTPPVEDVLERAAAAGVGAVITVGESVSSSVAAVELAERFDGTGGPPAVWATVGVHPHNAKDYDHGAAALLRELAEHPRVVAIGETGLDFHYDHSPREAQHEAFAAQLAVAREVGLPVVIHDREAHEETLAAVENHIADLERRARSAAPATGRGPAHAAEHGAGHDSQARPGVVLHCFSGDAAWASRFLALGAHLAFGGVLTFPKADAARMALAVVPLDRLLTETDCPYLSPEPFRGRENEPARVALVAEAIAAQRGLGSDAVAEAVARNARAVFGV